MARKNAIVSVVFADTKKMVEMSATAQLITITVAGEAKPIILDESKLSVDVLGRALTHGLIQKVSDAAALGKDSTPADKHAAMLATVERLLSGDWNKRGDADGTSPIGGIIFRALLAWKSSADPEKLRAWYDAKPRIEQLALRDVPEIKAEMERIKSERGPGKTIDTSSLLSDLDAL